MGVEVVVAWTSAMVVWVLKAEMWERRFLRKLKEPLLLVHSPEQLLIHGLIPAEILFW